VKTAVLTALVEQLKRAEEDPERQWQDRSGGRGSARTRSLQFQRQDDQDLIAGLLLGAFVNPLRSLQIDENSLSAEQFNTYVIHIAQALLALDPLAADGEYTEHAEVGGAERA
jgi:hypothetical protein